MIHLSKFNTMTLRKKKSKTLLMRKSDTEDRVEVKKKRICHSKTKMILEKDVIIHSKDFLNTIQRFLYLKTIGDY